jgi:hypothetical protein
MQTRDLNPLSQLWEYKAYHYHLHMPVPGSILTGYNLVQAEQ